MHSDFYQTAHLVVAALRLVEFTKNRPPSCEDVCQTLSYTLEHGNLILRKLEDMGIVESVKSVEGVQGTKYYIKDHLRLEEIPQEVKESRLDAELKKFQSAKTDYSKKIESIKSQQNERKKSLFAELEKQFKKDLQKE